MVVVTLPEPARRSERVWAQLRALALSAWKPAVLLAFACWVIAVGAHHEAWFDEAQAWLLARDSSLSELLLRRVRYEGSPGLWHALLWLCIKAGLPFAKLYLVSAACAVGGAAIVLWSGPFPAFARIAFIASYFPAYQYSVIARSYSLDLVLMPALAARFARRAERPILYGVLVGLLANCNAHSFVVAAVLGCELVSKLYRAVAWRTQAAAIGVGSAVALGLFSAVCAWQPAENGFLLSYDGSSLFAAVRFVGDAFIDRLSPWSGEVPTVADLLQGLALSLILMLPAFLLFWRAGMMPLAVAVIAALVGFTAWKYGQPWHSGLLFLFWFFLLWVSWQALAGEATLKRVVAVSLTLFCTAQAAEAVRSGLWDVSHPYSSGARTADAIASWRQSHPQGKIAGFGFKAFGVQPFFPANIFTNYHGGAASPAYVTWDRAEPWPIFPLPQDWNALAAGRFDLLVVSPYWLKPDALAERTAVLVKAGYQLTATVPGSMEWKGYKFEDNSLLLFSKGPDAG